MKKLPKDKRFGIEKVEFKGACSSSTRLVFDKLGRVYSPLKNAKYSYEKTLAKNNSPCVIRLSSKKNSLCIVVDTLSGYAYIPEFKTLNTQHISIKNKNYTCSTI